MKEYTLKTTKHTFSQRFVLALCLGFLSCSKIQPYFLFSFLPGMSLYIYPGVLLPPLLWCSTIPPPNKMQAMTFKIFHFGDIWQNYHLPALNLLGQMFCRKQTRFSVPIFLCEIDCITQRYHRKSEPEIPHLFKPLCKWIQFSHMADIL